MTAALRAAGCVFAEDEARLLLAEADSRAELLRLVDQRVSGLPLEHILGWVEFRGRRVAVDPGVFVPRRRTGFLVAEALPLARPGAVVVDLCCGSGAVGAALAAELGDVGLGRIELHATDIDPVAVSCARRNLLPLDGSVFEGDLYEPLPARLRGRVDLLIANAPYVPSGSIGTMPPEARLHEPLHALDGGADGLELQRRIVREAPSWLAPGGKLLIETSAAQAARTVDIFTLSGLNARITESREFDATIVMGSGADI